MNLKLLINLSIFLFRTIKHPHFHLQILILNNKFTFVQGPHCKRKPL